MNPLVSICLPVYNAEKTIGKTIASILTQTYPGIELIVVDNCSTDNSVEIARSFHDPRIRIIQYNIHVPYAELSWNRCFQYATGGYLALFHADDIYLPEMVAHQIKLFGKYSSLAGVFTLGNIINNDDIITGTFKIPEEVKGHYPYTYKELFPLFLKYADFLPTPSAMIRRDVYTKCSPFRYDQFKSASDLDMWLRVLEYGTIAILKENLMNYRVSQSQGSHTINRLRTKESDYFKVMDFHLTQSNVPEKIKMSYELSRFGDQILCQKNFLRIYLSRLVSHPGLIYEKYKMYSYFKRFKG